VQIERISHTQRERGGNSSVYQVGQQ
jgi:hypothetical protein